MAVTIRLLIVDDSAIIRSVMKRALAADPDIEVVGDAPDPFVARDLIIEKEPGAVFVFPASTQVLRNPDILHPFRQESNFYYLSGFDEPESFLVMAPSSSGAYRTILFVLPRDPMREIWEGERYGTEGAVRVFGFDEAFTVSELEKKLVELVTDCEKIYYRVGENEATDRRVLAALEGARRAQGRSGKSILPIVDPKEIVGEMRLFKQPEEVACLRKASQISAMAHQTVMKELRPGMNESEIAALFDFVCRKNGCARQAYDSIVAGGKNATCLHYVSNNDVLREGDLLLIDAGGEYDYYAGDITRSYPVGKSFTKAQGAIYDLVLKAQKEAIALARPGSRFTDLHDRATLVMVEGLLALGLLKGDPQEIIQKNEHKRFYPHNTSHWIGMDVHDVGLYKTGTESRVLEPGMCLTVEPGLYFQPNDTGVPEPYRNIGIRIEEDVLITEKGCEVLTQDAPKERVELEKIRSF